MAGPRDGNGVKPCVDGKPHCFSSSPERFDDNDLFNADYGTTAGWLVDPFKYDKPLAEALSEQLLREVRKKIWGYSP